MKIYIGSAIQGLSDSEYQKMRGQIGFLRENLKALGHEILDYKSTVNREYSPKEIFEHDYRNCMECDAMIALALYPSTGLGLEIATCLSRMRDGQACPAIVLALADPFAIVSKLLVGWKHPSFKFIRYQEFERIPEIFEQFCKTMRA